MKKLLVFVKAAMIIMSVSMSTNLMATNVCSSDKTTPVCQQVNSTTTKDLCLNNNQLPAHFASNPSSTLGTCADFNVKKIKTYACNAGLRFLKSSTQTCIKYDEFNATAPTCGTSLNCTCFDNVSDDTKTNFFNFGIADYKDGSAVTFVPRTLDASKTNAYAMASNKSGAQVLQDGSALQFNFGSEVYGAEYFVDLCVQNKNSNPEKYDLDLTGQILFNNSIFKKVNYNTAAALMTKIDVSCVNSKGDLATETIVKERSLINPVTNYTNTIDGSSLCVLRHYFRESAKNKVRENSFKKVTFQTNITVTPNDSKLSTPTPVYYCNMTKVKNKTICAAWTSPSKEAFATDVATNNGANFFGNDTYSIQCSKSSCSNF